MDVSLIHGLGTYLPGVCAGAGIPLVKRLPLPWLKPGIQIIDVTEE